MHRWLDEGSAPYHAYGKLEIEGVRLAFSLESAAGTVDYDGEISDRGDLVLDTNGSVNHYRETGLRFEFVATSTNELVRYARESGEEAYRFGDVKGDATRVYRRRGRQGGLHLQLRLRRA